MVWIWDKGKSSIFFLGSELASCEYRKKKSGEPIGFSLNYQPFPTNATVFMKTCVICLWRCLSQHSDLATFYLLLVYWRELLILITWIDNSNTSHSSAARMFLSVQNICLYKKKKGDLTGKGSNILTCFIKYLCQCGFTEGTLKTNSVPGAAADLLGDWGQVTLTCLFFSLHKMKITVLRSLVKCPEVSGLP